MVVITSAISIIQLVCSLGFLKYIIAPFFPLINIPMLISSFIPLMLIFVLAIPPINGFNHKKDDPDPKSKDWGYGSAWAFLVYYIIAIIIVSIVIATGCSVSKKVRGYNVSNPKDPKNLLALANTSANLYSKYK